MWRGRSFYGSSSGFRLAACGSELDIAHSSNIRNLKTVWRILLLDRACKPNWPLKTGNSCLQNEICKHSRIARYPRPTWPYVLVFTSYLARLLFYCCWKLHFEPLWRKTWKLMWRRLPSRPLCKRYDLRLDSFHDFTVVHPTVFLFANNQHYALVAQGTTSPNNLEPITEVYIHGWVYNIENGQVSDLGVSVAPPGKNNSPTPFPITPWDLENLSAWGVDIYIRG